MSTKKPQLDDLVRELRSELAEEDVNNLAIMLKVKEWRNLSKQNQLLDAMTRWLESDSEASWEKIARALHDIGKKVLAKHLKEKYCSNTAANPQPDIDIGIMFIYMPLTNYNLSYYLSL